MAAPDILLIGHVARDLLSTDPNDGYRLGGTVSFAAVTSVRLGRRPTIVTAAAPGLDVSELPREVELHVLPSEATTTFVNTYTEAGRIQHCSMRARPITAADIDPSLRRPRAALLGPIADEITPDVAHVLAEETLVVATPQGWMRRFDESGRVHGKPWESAPEILPHVDAVVLSLEDINADLRRLDPIVAQVPLVVVTEYRDGSTLYRRRDDGSISVTRIPPRPAREIDPTGAGDVFATAFMIRFQETGDPVEAARFANVTASFGVEAVGVAGIPSRDVVLAYMQENPFRGGAHG
ncbi:PfkB family carbohydrate kinase [Polyangium mundeleinium]|uniref:PfkB family carbohydrate kinase n=1 Tax=Polyangium mundeleinium TaxID=2995306 RepID=A0ABT5EKC9_9BACT|nr:PfkB family carbohydrate kinase [Polyangium mundeleinium]MDC0741633.1 PfkB family carbohydrate kinase [Polyangium mundeleinium]